MIRLSTVIETFEADFLAQYRNRLRPEHLQALAAIKRCRTQSSLKLQVSCTECPHQRLMPHSCGHRHCPHCQHHESQQWLERQMQKQVPADYFLLTFTVPAEFRVLAFAHQRTIYEVLMRCAWETVRTFSQNDKQLQGSPGAIAVLHTNTRRLDFHPHVHLVMPAAAVDDEHKQWRTKRRGKGKKGYLFNHAALGKVFRGKLLAALKGAGLALPDRYPEAWVVDCKSVGSGAPALIYLGRYLYRGVIREQDIVSSKDGQVCFRYRNAKNGRMERRILPGFSLADPAACAAQRLSAGTQFRLSASELQAPDRLAARAAQVRTGSAKRQPQGTSVDPLCLLWRSNGDRENENTLCRGRCFAAKGIRKGTLIM